MARKGVSLSVGRGEKMRKPGAKGAPTAAAFRKSAKTAQRSLSGYGGLPAMKRIKKGK